MRGVEALPDRYEITVDDLKGAITAAEIQLKVGDVVLVRTGKIRDFFNVPAAFQAAQPGIGVDAAVWLTDDLGAAVLRTDTTGTELLPFVDDSHTAHRVMLVDRGVHLLEDVVLDEMAAEGVAEAIFVCTPLKITGASGSWVRPIAVV